MSARWMKPEGAVRSDTESAVRIRITTTSGRMKQDGTGSRVKKWHDVNCTVQYLRSLIRYDTIHG